MLEAFRYFVRFGLQIPSVYIPGELKHVLLFSSRRSGSTLLRNAFYALPGFNYIDQPLDPWQFNPHLGRLRGGFNGPLTSVTDEEWESVRAYFADILSRKKIVRSQWQVWRADYRWAWSRYVVKILNAKALMPRFEEAFEQDAGIVYATRHPIPAALSVIRQGWGLTAEAFLDDDRFRESHLAPTTVDNARRILHEGTLLERHVLNWCLENLLPLQRWQSSNWFTISFERLVGFPHESAARIVRFAQAGVEADVLTALSRPTRTTSRSSKGSIATSGPESRIEAWRSQVGPDDIRRVGKLLAMFEVDLYNPNETQPLQAFDGIS